MEDSEFQFPYGYFSSSRSGYGISTIQAFQFPYGYFGPVYGVEDEELVDVSIPLRVFPCGCARARRWRWVSIPLRVFPARPRSVRDVAEVGFNSLTGISRRMVYLHAAGARFNSLTGISLC